MKKIQIIISLAILVGVFVFAVGWGSVNISAGDIFHIIVYRTLGIGNTPDLRIMNIVWYSRMPRVLLAFIVGAALSVSGAIMQSVLRNPLASSYTLGVSSGASLGAALVLFSGLPVLLNFALPASGFAFGMTTIVLVVAMAMKMDGRMDNNTIVLVGMVLSLFINSITTLLMAVSREYAQRLIFWQMGSFSMQHWSTVFLLAPIIFAGVLIAIR